MYWSPKTGAQPLTGAIYAAWGQLGFERGALGLPTSGEIAEPEWIVQNFQHGTLNFDRQTHNVIRVIDGVSLVLPPRRRTVRRLSWSGSAAWCRGRPPRAAHASQRRHPRLRRGCRGREWFPGPRWRQTLVHPVLRCNA